MPGILKTITHPNGITTEFAAITQFAWQPGLAANIRVGHFLTKDSFLNKKVPITDEYLQLDIEQISENEPLLVQCLRQALVIEGSLCVGGVLDI